MCDQADDILTEPEIAFRQSAAMTHPAMTSREGNIPVCNGMWPDQSLAWTIEGDEEKKENAYKNRQKRSEYGSCLQGSENRTRIPRYTAPYTHSTLHYASAVKMEGGYVAP